MNMQSGGKYQEKGGRDTGSGPRLGGVSPGMNELSRYFSGMKYRGVPQIQPQRAQREHGGNKEGKGGDQSKGLEMPSSGNRMHLLTQTALPCLLSDPLEIDPLEAP
jgi:hypothetical protein